MIRSYSLLICKLCYLFVILIMLATSVSLADAKETILSDPELTDPSSLFTKPTEQAEQLSEFDVRNLVVNNLNEEEISDCCSVEEENYEQVRLDPFLAGLDVYGHVRVRQETDFNRLNSPTRNRQRLRARLGAVYQPADQWQIGLRMTTGDRKLILESGDRSGAPLSYQDAGDVFDKFEFNLDRIFIRYEPYCIPGSWIQVGKFPLPMELNPLTRGPIGTMAWDEAAHPEGVAAGLSWIDYCGIDQIKFVVGESAVLELKNADDASLFFSQVWAQKSLNSCWDLASGIAFFGWYNLNPDGNNQISTENNNGNETVGGCFVQDFA